MTDNRKSTITAKLAAQIVEYYKQAMKYLESSQQANIISGRQYKVGRIYLIAYVWVTWQLSLPNREFHYTIAFCRN